jgi:hypothetical protein
VSVKYEDFVQQPEQWLRYIYDSLGLSGFDRALPQFRAFIAGQRNYQKNKHTMRPALRYNIKNHLGFYFEHYGYVMQTENTAEGVR